MQELNELRYMEQTEPFDSVAQLSPSGHSGCRYPTSKTASLCTCVILGQPGAHLPGLLGWMTSHMPQYEGPRLV